ncbi:glycosyltransferase family 2 protein [Pseudoclavibacter sp. JSM 162008]|uniref:glycosyltransferase family 2 protein n=1 Tax=Pseudoclavibacter sp. JSM 162008 TaxID=3229855 RepID=UPI00352567D2
MKSARFSVIIPTLQKSERLKDLIARCVAHPLVKEILIINNSVVPLEFASPKVRVLQQSANIYVNPAWNLGAKEATAELLAIVNDDVLFHDEALTYSARLLKHHPIGIVGPDLSTFNQLESGRISYRLARPDATVRYFGTFMCLRRRDYVPIPEEMRIWGGDDWLIAHQSLPPAVLIRTQFETDMSTTSSSPEFQRLRVDEYEAAERWVLPLRGKRWWHRPLASLATLRVFVYRTRTQLARTKREKC